MNKKEKLNYNMKKTKSHTKTPNNKNTYKILSVFIYN